MKDTLLNPKQHKPGERWLVRFQREVSEITIVEYSPSGAYVKVRWQGGSETWLEEMPLAVEKLDAAPVNSKPMKLSERDFQRLTVLPKYDGPGTPLPPNPMVVSMPGRLPGVVECKREANG